MIRSLIVGLVFVLGCFNSVWAQSVDDEISVNNFDSKLVEELLFDRINEFRVTNGLAVLERHQILTEASDEQSKYFAEIKRVDSRDDIGGRVEDAGGTSNAFAIGAYSSAKKGKTYRTYAYVADQIFEKFTKSKKNERILLVTDYYYGAVGANITEDGKRVYASAVFGRVDVLNLGADKLLRKSLPLKYNKKKRGLTKASEQDKVCKGCKKFKDWAKLYEGISIRENKVYLEYDNFKALKKLLKRDGDGLAIDIIMPQQFPCGSDNIYNTEVASRGVLSKPYYSSKIIDKNLIEGKRVRTYQGVIGKLKKKVIKNLPPNTEINLLVIQNKNVCKVIKRTYLETGDFTSEKSFALHVDTSTTDKLDQWVPKAETATLDFNIPFEQGKTEYDISDAKEMLSALNEPKFNINAISIVAQSSIEGDSAKNAELQQKRAESIVLAVEKVSGDTALLKPENITTNDGWEFFQSQIKDNEDYTEFAALNIEGINNLIRKDMKALEKLEPLLEEQRFASINMSITYDISGKYEQPFVMAQFRKAIEDKKDGALALKIQKFAMKRIFEGKYNAQNFINFDVPMEEQFAPVIANQHWLKYKFEDDGKLDEDYFDKYAALKEKAPENPVINYNNNILFVQYKELENEAQIKGMQSSINKLYTSDIPVEMLDKLNLEFQFRTIEFMDTIGMESELVDKSLEKIRNIYKIDDASWQSGLKLGYIFIDAGELKFAESILSKFINDNAKVNEEYYFTYIATAAHFPEKLYSRAFTTAMSGARKANTERYCKLFGAPKLSFQMLEHPAIKREYCDACK